jgi:kinetochore protein Mis12/MTW1
MAVEDGQKRTDAVMGLVEGVNRLRRKLQASQRLQCMLVAERARNAALLGEMRRLVGGLGGGVKSEVGAEQQQQQQQQQHQQAPGQGEERGGEKAPQTTPPLRFLHDQGDLTTGDAETPLTTTTAFTLSQLQALRELSAALRGAMPGLASPLGGEATAASASDDDDHGGGRDGQKKKSWRQERLEYVETATRKHLENVRGLELGRDGEVRDGEWDGGGRGLARGEVESLERVVSLLGGSRDEQDRMDES